MSAAWRKAIATTDIRDQPACTLTESASTSSWRSRRSRSGTLGRAYPSLAGERFLDWYDPPFTGKVFRPAQLN